MQHFERLIEIDPTETRTRLLAKGGRWTPQDGHPRGPIAKTLRGEHGPSRLLAEFDANGRAEFAELCAPYPGREDALMAFRQLGAQIERADLVQRDAPRPGPIRRSSVAMSSLLAWNSWVLDPSRQLQAIVGAFRPVRAGNETVKLAVSLHMPHGPGYGPKAWDISTGQALGWEDFERQAPADLFGRRFLLRSIQSDGISAAAGGPSPSDTMFKLFR